MPTTSETALAQGLTRLCTAMQKAAGEGIPPEAQLQTALRSMQDPQTQAPVAAPETPARGSDYYGNGEVKL